MKKQNRLNKKHFAFMKEIFPELNAEQMEVLLLKSSGMSQKEIGLITETDAPQVTRLFHEIQKKYPYLSVQTLPKLFKLKTELYVINSFFRKT